MRIREWLAANGPRLFAFGFMITLAAHTMASPWTS